MDGDIACMRTSLCEVFFCLFNENRRGDEMRREEVDIPIPPFVRNRA